MIGTSPLFRLKDVKELIIIGFTISGLPNSVLAVLSLPEMVEAVVRKHPELKSVEGMDKTV